jgi:hypothetical protein
MNVGQRAVATVHLRQWIPTFENRGPAGVGASGFSGATLGPLFDYRIVHWAWTAAVPCPTSFKVDVITMILRAHVSKASAFSAK